MWDSLHCVFLCSLEDMWVIQSTKQNGKFSIRALTFLFSLERLYQEVEIWEHILFFLLFLHVNFSSSLGSVFSLFFYILNFLSTFLFVVVFVFVLTVLHQTSSFYIIWRQNRFKARSIIFVNTMSQWNLSLINMKNWQVCCVMARIASTEQSTRGTEKMITPMQKAPIPGDIRGWARQQHLYWETLF